MNWVNTFKNLPDEEKKALVQKAYDTGYHYEATAGNCPQCVLATIGDIFGCYDAAAFKAAYNFGGGYGLTGQGTCGAANGAAMLISLIHGRDREGFEAGGRYPKSLELTRKFLDRFTGIFDASVCCDVHKKIFNGKSYILCLKEEYKAFEEAGGHVDKCTDVVGAACKIIAQMIVDGEI